LRDGLSTKEVAVTLAIAERTADWHVRNILTKLAARNRAHAVAVAFAHGMLADPRHRDETLNDAD
jgi:DNA-binding CsgD family transcriptional regulator